MFYSTRFCIFEAEKSLFTVEALRAIVVINPFLASFIKSYLGVTFVHRVARQQDVRI
jgi:hypothetical protein